MEREALFTGVGGQGVQIASKTLAMAAIAEGRQVLLVPRYGGGMRGGMTNAEVSIGEGPLRALPVVTSAWSAYVMDPSYFHTIAPNLAPGAVVVANSSLCDDLEVANRYDVAASAMAAELGNPMSAGFVLLGAFAALTGIVGLPALTEAMRRLVPPYRTQHVAANERAIAAGAQAVPALAVAAWTEGKAA